MTPSLPSPVRAAAVRIAEALTEVGVRASGVLLVHSSLSALGQVPGGAQTVIQGLLQALGRQGTLLMPALSYERVTSKNPVFDVRRTPSNVGLIPETFRRRPATLRSMHPTHSVCAVGPRAKPLLENHDQDTTPCGPHSPFHRLPDVGGQILMLGCGLKPNTSMHAIEEEVRPPYLLTAPRTYVLIYPDGTPVERTYTPHDFNGWTQRYDRVAGILEPPALRTGRVLDAEVHLLEARKLWDAALAALQTDPLFFVEREGTR